MRTERAKPNALKGQRIPAQGGGLDGLALSYYHAAPPGLPKGDLRGTRF